MYLRFDNGLNSEYIGEIQSSFLFSLIIGGLVVLFFLIVLLKELTIITFMLLKVLIKFIWKNLVIFWGWLRHVFLPVVLPMVREVLSSTVRTLISFWNWQKRTRWWRHLKRF